MLFGAEQRGEIVDELTEHLHEHYGSDEIDINDIRKNAKKNIEKSQSYNQKYFAEHHIDAKKFKIGDLVVIKNVDNTPGKNKKFINKYRGPYCITNDLGNDRYVVEDVENCQLTQMPYENVIDSSRMKLWMEHLKNENEVDKGNTLDLSDETLDVSE